MLLGNHHDRIVCINTFSSCLVGNNCLYVISQAAQVVHGEKDE